MPRYGFRYGCDCGCGCWGPWRTRHEPWGRPLRREDIVEELEDYKKELEAEIVDLEAWIKKLRAEAA